MLKYPKIKPNWRIQITAKNWPVFGAPPALNVMATAFLWLQCKFHNILGKQNGCQENLDILWLQGARKHIFVHSLWSGLHFALTKTTAICVYFSAASPKVLTLSKIWRGRRTLSASLSKWEGHIDRLECGQLRLLTGVKGRKFWDQ